MNISKTGYIRKYTATRGEMNHVQQRIKEITRPLSTGCLIAYTAGICAGVVRYAFYPQLTSPLAERTLTVAGSIMIGYALAAALYDIHGAAA